MYAYFIGKVKRIEKDAIVLETNNIGYNIIMPSSDIANLEIDMELKVYTYTAVREDAFLLYGFTGEDKLHYFKLLIEVNGVGPKAAISILSNISVEDLICAIIAADAKLLSKTPGIGSKTAARIILDLKDKVSNEDILGAGGPKAANVSAESTLPKQEAMEALCALGYSNTEAMKALNMLEISEDSDVSELISEALRLL